jgi:hypothetical protein
MIRPSSVDPLISTPYRISCIASDEDKLHAKNLQKLIDLQQQQQQQHGSSSNIYIN